MKLSFSIVLAVALSGVSAENYYNYNNAANQNAQNYNNNNQNDNNNNNNNNNDNGGDNGQNEAQGYAAYNASSSSYNASEVDAYDEEYYSNYDADYVQEMNYNNGNFQYYDADGQYNQSFSSAGYYDDYGAFHFYSNENNAYYYGGDDGDGNDGDDGAGDDAGAADYYQDGQNNGGANGYYDNDGSWTGSSYENVPCQSWSQQQVSQYADDQDDADAQGDDYNEAWSNGNYNQNVDNSDWQAYMNECDETMRIRTNNCDNSVVHVKNVTILCDSPYRSYYSRSSHYSSQLCEYGDHAIVMVFFDVLEDLDWMQNIYMTFGIYAGKQQKELLWAVRSVELCNTFVGHQCSHSGSYAFAFQVSFDYGSLSDRSLFVPLIEMGFSTRADEGYNLGGVNINCKFNKFYQQYDPWYNGKRAHASQIWGAGGLGKAAGQFGILIGVVLLAIAFGLFTYTRRAQIEFQGNADELIDGKEKDKETTMA